MLQGDEKGRKEEVIHDTGSLIEECRSGAKDLSRGFTTILNIIEFPKALQIRGLNIIYPTHSDYKLAIEIMKDLLKEGKPVPAIDILVAAIAINNELTLRTRDRHFTAVKAVRRELKVEII